MQRLETALKNVNETGNVVEQCDLFVFPCGFVGSSPDGIICEQHALAANGGGVLEVKCPLFHRNSLIDEIIKAELKGKDKQSSFYLTAIGDLNKDHRYWYQVKGEMVAAIVCWAHFGIWMTIDMQTLKVERVDSWEKTYKPILKDFYLTELLPYCFTKEN